ncbi:squalene/phytoene synthase family protein, partial [Verrucomicrobia bacterium]|nr:squalene/phytoene synthase family protein [Verrucomicrobiota bacterium]
KHLAGSMGLPERQAFIVGCGLDFSELEKVPELPPAFDLVFLGRMHEQKGIFDLPDVWKAVLDHNPSARMVVIGEGPHRRRLQELMAERGLSRGITFTGGISESEKNRYLKVFECSHSNIPTYGYHLGQALQLTNILRDIHSDAAKNRIYVPRELLDKHGVSEADILSGKFSIQFRKVAQELAERAKYHYQQTSEHVPSEERSAMVASEMMAAVYWRILRKIEKQDFQVLRKDKTKLSKFQKLTLIARSFLRHWLRVGHSDYG